MNARLTWATVAVLLSMALWNTLTGGYAKTALVLVGVGAVVLPAIAYRDTSVVPPWGVSLALTIAVGGYSFGPSALVVQAATYFVLVALAALIIVEVQVFTPVEMEARFASGFVVFASMAAAGLWTVFRWLSDTYLGTSAIDTVDALMWDLALTSVVGLIGAALSIRYFSGLENNPRGFSEGESSDSSYQPIHELVHPAEEFSSTSYLRQYVNLGALVGLSGTFERTLVRILQAILAGLFVFTLFQENISLLINTGIALAVTIAPIELRRKYDVPLDSGLVLWITAAISIHVLGSLWLYGRGGWYDQLAHLLSATIVSGIGYAGLRAIEISTPEIEIPQRYMAFFTVVLILAFGVLWEVLEYTLGDLTVYGIDDTALDLLFDALGAGVVAVLDTPQLRRLARDVAERFA
ncbi:MAG TPA: hypothetical protein VFJ06_00015 [Halococcus sp.]|nr:hypothetical protein [Halococcus sp.]